MARSVLVLQHASSERPGLLGRVLAERGVPLVVREVAAEADPALPRPDALAGLVVMGGPMNADDDARHPGLAAERRLLADAVDAGLPTIGVCLGMQLLARALGATVHAGHGTEIGLAPVDVVAPDPVLDPLGRRPTVLHWHSDAADLPPGATLLARTATTPVQAFRAGSAIGVQFHPEMTPDLLDAWLADAATAAEARRHGVTDLAADAARVLPGLEPAARAGLGAFADAVLARG